MKNWQRAYINDVIIKENPHSMTLHNADVVATAQSATTVNHDRYQIIHSIRVACIVRLRHTTGQNLSELRTSGTSN